ncbi:MAG: response regulator [Desulfuromusa sp.]|jgi:twitching motility two-component system response regulator PilG|nr:response regulator [Desulfuromusa sp.]
MPPKILVVEDDESILNLECILLASAGYQASAAMSGNDAFNNIANNPPDLILLDVMLPGLDGLEICKQLKSNAKTQHIPVIFLSGKSTPADILKGKQVGGDQYITKPFKSATLMNSINQLLKIDTSGSTVKRGFY